MAQLSHAYLFAGERGHEESTPEVEVEADK
jgi:hypothetical protein